MAKQVLETNIGIEAAHLVGNQEQVHIGNDFQYDFLYKMKTIFPNPERLCPATNWFGFHFRVLPEKVADDGRVLNKQWFGFTKWRGGVILGLNTGIPNCRLHEARGIEYVDNVFQDTTFLKITLDGQPKTTPEWKLWLDPVLSELRVQLVAKASLVAALPITAQ